MAVNILYVNGGPMNRGGIEAFMMNYVRHMNHAAVHIDFAVTGLEKGAYDDELELDNQQIVLDQIEKDFRTAFVPFAYKDLCKDIFKQLCLSK